MADYYIGLISGTSADGIDAALVQFDNHSASLVASHSEPLSDQIKASLFSLFSAEARPNTDAIDLMGSLDNELGHCFAKAALNLLESSGLNKEQICAIGSHGQTIRHRPAQAFTTQIGNPNIIAELTQIDVVADFRRRDMAIGGQGAPLAPAFHRAFLASADENTVVLNLGGIANVTWLPKQENTVLGFDTGPSNGLMDAWILRHKQQAFDRDGAWASTAKPNAALVQQWLADPYFSALPPKSTGKEYFHLQWAQQRAPDMVSSAPAEVQASLLELSAQSIFNAIERHCPQPSRVLVCGGGVHNSALMKRLRTLCPCPVESTATFGIDPDWMEAMAFAWMAKQFKERQALDLRSITGSSRPAILGALYPGQ